jgi:hypothetical protein
MKTKSVTLLLVSLLSASTVICQNTSEKRKTKKNTFSIELYQPVDNLVKPFYDFESLFGIDTNVDSNNSANSFSSAIGISYERIQNDVVFRPRLGISFINSKNHSNHVSINSAEDYKSILNQNDHYSQNHINLFIGIAKRIHLNDRFSIDCGFDLASIYYLKGRGDYDYNIQQVKISDNSPIANQTINVNDRIGPIVSMGIGPIIKPQYTIYKNIVVSMELQVYFMRTVSNGTASRQQISYSNVFAENYSEYIDVYGEINYHINQWNWTKISPLLRIGYQF